MPDLLQPEASVSLVREALGDMPFLALLREEPAELVRRLDLEPQHVNSSERAVLLRLDDGRHLLASWFADDPEFGVTIRGTGVWELPCGLELAALLGVSADAVAWQAGTNAVQPG